jgi:hypothetical protein
MTGHHELDEVLRAQGDVGCTTGETILAAYVELELSGEDPTRVFPGTAIHPPELPRLSGRSRRAALSDAPLRAR